MEAIVGSFFLIPAFRSIRGMRMLKRLFQAITRGTFPRNGAIQRLILAAVMLLAVGASLLSGDRVALAAANGPAGKVAAINAAPNAQVVEATTTRPAATTTSTK